MTFDGMTFERFLELLQGMHSKDEDAAAELLEWLSHCCRAWFGTNVAVTRDPLWCEDLVSHLAIRLRGKFDVEKCRDLPAALNWLKRVATNYLLDTFRAQENVSSLDGGEDDDQTAMDPPDPRPPMEDKETLDVDKFAGKLDEIHSIVRQSLPQGQVNYVAVYLLDFRLQLYTLLRREEGSVSRDPLVLMDAVEAVMPWSEEDQRTAPRKDWPSLENLWEELRQSMRNTNGESLLITAEAVAEAASRFSCQQKCFSPDAYYQWRRRLRQKLQSLLDNNKFANIELRLVDAWKKVVFLEDKSNKQRRYHE